MRVTVMKMYYAKQKPSIVHYHKFKNSIRSSKFPNELKQADIAPAHTKVKAF